MLMFISTLVMMLPKVASCRTSHTSLFRRLLRGPGRAAPAERRIQSCLERSCRCLRRQPYCPSVYGEAGPEESGPWPWTGTRVSSCVFCLIPGGCEIVFAHRSHAASEAP